MYRDCGWDLRGLGRPPIRSPLGRDPTRLPGPLARPAEASTGLPYTVDPMIVPLGTDRDGRRPPVATVLLIVLNVGMYVAMKAGAAALWTSRAEIDLYRAAFADVGGISNRQLFDFLFVETMAANPWKTPWWTLFTAMFTHSPSSILHIAGNMLFLWAFGKSIESHIGFWRFLLLYLGGGLAAWVAHSLVSDAPGIGASGATSSVACLFLAFFPRSQTKVLYLFGMSLHYVPSAWLIGLYFTIDVVKLFLDTAGVIPTDVAVGAHLGGALFGIGAGLLMLRLGWAPRGDWDLLHLSRQFLRRRAMRAALASSTGPTPWASGKARGSIVDGAPLAGKSAEEATYRATIVRALAADDDRMAIDAYASLVALVPGAVLHVATHLDLANRALRAGRIDVAVVAYENYLLATPNEAKAGEVRLLLAAVYLRRLGRAEDARRHLKGLSERLHDAEQRALATALEAEANGGAA